MELSTRRYERLGRGSNPLESTNFNIMETYYTRNISQEVLDALHEVNYPFEYEKPFGNLNNHEVSPTYADVLDWLANNDMFISIDKIADSEYWAFNRKRATSIHAQNLNFQKSLDEAILLAIDFLKNDDV